MKKIIAFTTALLILSSASSLVVFGEEDTKAEEIIAEVTTEAADTEAPDKVVSEETPAENGDSETAEAEDTAADTDDKENTEESGWGLTLNKAADAELKIAEDVKEYLVFIKNPGGAERGGVDKWDIQFKIRGLTITKGHDYTITYRISASNAGNYYTKISNYDSATVGDAVAGEVWHNQLGVSTMKSYANGILKNKKETNYGDAWSLQSIARGDTINVTCDFTAIETIPEAEWAFFLGGAGDTTPHDCFASGTELRFTNLTLTDNTTGEKLVEAFPFINSPVLGDINADGVADMTDVSELCLAKLGDKSLDDAQINNADVDGNGAFELADIAHFMRYISGEIKSLDNSSDSENETEAAE